MVAWVPGTPFQSLRARHLVVLLRSAVHARAATGPYLSRHTVGATHLAAILAERAEALRDCWYANAIARLRLSSPVPRLFLRPRGNDAHRAPSLR